MMFVLNAEKEGIWGKHTQGKEGPGSGHTDFIFGAMWSHQRVFSKWVQWSKKQDWDQGEWELSGSWFTWVLPCWAGPSSQCSHILSLTSTAGACSGNHYLLLNLSTHSPSPNHFPTWGSKPPMIGESRGTCTCRRCLVAGANWRVVLCPSGQLLLNSSRCTKGAGEARSSQIFWFRKSSQKSRCVRKPLVLKCQHQIQIKITFSELSPWTLRPKSCTKPDLSLREPPGQNHCHLLELQSREVKVKDAQETAGALHSGFLNLFWVVGPSGHCRSLWTPSRNNVFKCMKSKKLKNKKKFL